MVADCDLFSPEQLTLSVWVNPTGSSGTILQKGTSSSTQYWLYTSRKGWNVTLRNEGQQQKTLSFGEVIPGQWQHVAVTWDNTMIRAYVGGTEVAAQPYSGTSINNPTVLLKVGANRWNKHYFTGMLDDLRLYSRALTTNEIAALAGNAPTDPGPDSLMPP